MISRSYSQVLAPNCKKVYIDIYNVNVMLHNKIVTDITIIIFYNVHVEMF